MFEKLLSGEFEFEDSVRCSPEDVEDDYNGLRCVEGDDITCERRRTFPVLAGPVKYTLS